MVRVRPPSPCAVPAGCSGLETRSQPTRHSLVGARHPRPGAASSTPSPTSPHQADGIPASSSTLYRFLPSKRPGNASSTGGHRSKPGNDQSSRDSRQRSMASDATRLQSTRTYRLDVEADQRDDPCLRPPVPGVSGLVARRELSMLTEESSDCLSSSQWLHRSTSSETCGDSRPKLLQGAFRVLLPRSHLQERPALDPCARPR